MNTTTAACGHAIPAVGAPHSPAREKAERSPCGACDFPLSRRAGEEAAMTHNKAFWGAFLGEAQEPQPLTTLTAFIQPPLV